MDGGFLLNSFIFLAATCIVVPVASRFKLGSVIGYLTAGVLIGPTGAGLIGDARQIMQFAEFGVVMMLFLIGLELQPVMLWRLRKIITGLGGLQVILTSAAIAGIGLFFGYDWRICVAAGMTLSMSSTALVLQMLQEKNLMQSSMGETSFAVLLFQDIAVIPILVLLPLLAMPGAGDAGLHTGWLANMPGSVRALVVAMVIAAVIGGGRFLLPYLFHFIAKTNLREVFTATSLALVIGIALLMHSIGVSPALGAFVAGVMLANSPYRRTLETDIEPFKGLLLGLFFVSIGMGMNFTLLAQFPIHLPGAVIAIITVKAIILCILGRGFGLSGAQNIGFALALSQAGEFAFVLVQFSSGIGIFGGGQAAFLTLAIALSMAATPFLMLFYNRFILPRFMSVLPEPAFDDITESNAVILAGYGRFGQIVGRFMELLGVNVTVLENDPEQIRLLRKFGRQAYFGDASRLDLLQSAGAANARLLVVAVDDPDVCLNIVQLAREEFPGLMIAARARNRRHAYELDKLGVTIIKRETFDSALGMAREILIMLGHNPVEIQQKAAAFLRHDDATLKQSFEFFDTEPEYISFSRQASQEMERILREDISSETKD